jgi:single-strand DNA-binding protein
MPNVNKAILVGHLGKDPDLKTTQSGKSVCSFSLATTETYNGEKHPTWHNIVAWGKQAEVLAKYLHKGDAVYIEGRIDNRSYDDKEGNKKYISEVVVREFQFLPRGEKQQDNAPMPVSSGIDDNDDGLPF